MCWCAGGVLFYVYASVTHVARLVPPPPSYASACVVTVLSEFQPTISLSACGVTQDSVCMHACMCACVACMCVCGVPLHHSPYTQRGDGTVTHCTHSSIPRRLTQHAQHTSCECDACMLHGITHTASLPLHTERGWCKWW